MALLSNEQLTIAMQTADKAAQCCTRFCRSGASLDDGRYIVFHNSTGPSTTDTQTVHNTQVFELNVEQFAAQLQTWLTGLHTGKRTSLNDIS